MLRHDISAHFIKILIFSSCKQQELRIVTNYYIAFAQYLHKKFYCDIIYTYYVQRIYYIIKQRKESIDKFIDQYT